MGIEKSRQQEAEAAWDRKAQAEQLKCEHCFMKIPYWDREVYFATKMCAYCTHQLAKDD